MSLHKSATVLATLLVGTVCGAGGCGPSSERGRIAVPEVVPEAAAAQALATYDKNRDGFLDAQELDQCQALKSGLKRLDTDSNGRLNASEIAKRLESYRERKIGVVTVGCQVTLDNSSLAGATVTFVPESFLGSAVKPASGVSDSKGQVLLRIEGESVPGVNCGFFRIEVSKKNAEGKETLPARYNQRTTLGQEVAADMQEHGQGTVVLPLSSR